MESTYSQIGGARIGGGAFFAFNATWPFAKLSVTDTGLQLSVLGKRWIFPRDAIRALRQHSGIFSTGLRIDHTIATYTAFIVFWTFNLAQLEQELEKRGFHLSAQ